MLSLYNNISEQSQFNFNKLQTVLGCIYNRSEITLKNAKPDT